MIGDGLELAAGLYLVAGVAAWLGVLMEWSPVGRSAIALLALGAGVQGLAYVAWHQGAAPPPLTDLPAAVSLMAWAAVLFVLVFLARARLLALAGVVAPAAFLGTFFGALRLPHASAAPLTGGGSWPHLHVVLSSVGLALLGVACLAGLIFLASDRRLKARRPLRHGLRLPSLEALDRVNRVALGVGFLLLSLGVVTGLLWNGSARGVAWTGSAHEVACVVAWGVYALLAGARFAAHQRARGAAVSAVAGFAVLFVAVIGVGLLR